VTRCVSFDCWLQCKVVCRIVALVIFISTVCIAGSALAASASADRQQYCHSSTRTASQLSQLFNTAPSTGPPHLFGPSTMSPLRSPSPLLPATGGTSAIWAASCTVRHTTTKHSTVQNFRHNCPHHWLKLPHINCRQSSHNGCCQSCHDMCH
jgi:hypothetical protein